MTFPRRDQWKLFSNLTSWRDRRVSCPVAQVHVSLIHLYLWWQTEWNMMADLSPARLSQLISLPSVPSLLPFHAQSLVCRLAALTVTKNTPTAAAASSRFHITEQFKMIAGLDKVRRATNWAIDYSKLGALLSGHRRKSRSVWGAYATAWCDKMFRRPC